LTKVRRPEGEMPIQGSACPCRVRAEAKTRIVLYNMIKEFRNKSKT
jgi:hypothetical protein